MLIYGTVVQDMAFKFCPHKQPDKALFMVSEDGIISWLTSDDKWTVGVMTMQDDHREATAS